MGDRDGAGGGVAASQARVVMPSPPARHQMIFACTYGGLAGAQRLVEEGLPLIRPSGVGDTFFHVACSHGRLAVAQWLYELMRGTAIDTCTADLGQTPIFMACKGGQLKVAKWLYEFVPESRVAVSQTSTAAKLTPFFVACKYNKLDVARWLYESVPEAHGTVTQVNIFGITPFIYACRSKLGYRTALWLATLPPFRSELLGLSLPSVYPKLRSKLEPIVARAKDARALELMQLVRQHYWTKTGSAQVDHHDCDASSPGARAARRIVGRVGAVVMHEVGALLAPMNATPL